VKEDDVGFGLKKKMICFGFDFILFFCFDFSFVLFFNFIEIILFNLSQMVVLVFYIIKK